MKTNCRANAKLVVNKRLNMLRLLVTFDLASQRVTVLNAVYKSGDICATDMDPALRQHWIDREVARARDVLGTDQICFI